MLKAKSETGKLVMISKLSREKVRKLRSSQLYYCPECNEQVIIKAGKKVIAHFAHRAKSNCSYSSEGEYHEQGKYLLYQWLTSQRISAELEVYLPEIKQRPDVLILLNGKRIAVEFQCATVSGQVIKQRNLGYKKANVIPIWILSNELLHRYSKHSFRFNHFTLQFLHQFSSTTTATLFFFCPETIKFTTVHDVHVTGTKRAIGRFVEYSTKKLLFKDLFKQNDYTKLEIMNQWYRHLNYFRIKERGVAFGRGLDWRKWLYEKRVYIDELPSLLFIPVRSQYLFKLPLYDWQSRVLIDFLQYIEVGERFSFEKIQSMFQSLEVNRNMYPLLVNHSHPIYEYLEYLTFFGVLVKKSELEFEKIHNINFYQSIHEAVEGDRQIFQKIQKKAKNNNAKLRM